MAHLLGADSIRLAYPNRIVLDGVSLGNRHGEWRVRADGGGFDQIAGATLTSRAVLAATQQGLRYFDSHREHLLGAAP